MSALPFFELEHFGDAASPRVLLDIPHAAHTRVHLESMLELLDSRDVHIPARWERVFWCTTDLGALAIARETARRLSATHRVSLLAGYAPRHLLDFNRRFDPHATRAQGAPTAVVPGLIRDSVAALEALRDLHEAYAERAAHAYDEVAKAGGWCVQVHTCAPRSVPVPRGVDLANALGRQWSSTRRQQWPLRPDAQLIVARKDEPSTIGQSMVAELVVEFAELEMTCAINAPFTFHPSQMLDQWASRHPGKVFGVEVRRDLLASDESWEPLEEWALDSARVAECARALSLALLRVDPPCPR